MIAYTKNTMKLQHKDGSSVTLHYNIKLLFLGIISNFRQTNQTI